MTDFYEDLQQILMGQQERLYREFRDSSTAHALVDATRPKVTIYDPNGALEVASTSPINESTGVYYYNFTVTTAAAKVEGVYQAYWEGFINGAHVTMDTPQYILVKRFPWDTGETDDFINAIRREIGDTNPNNYRIPNRDLWYFTLDAINGVQAIYNMGYSASVSNTDGLALSAPLTVEAAALFKAKVVILVLKSVYFNGLFYAGNVSIGDIKVNVTGAMKERREALKDMEKDFDKILYDIKMNNITGTEIDTYITGFIRNQTNFARIEVDPNIGIY